MQVDQIHFLSVLSAIFGVLLIVLTFGAALLSTKGHEYRAASRIALLGVLPLSHFYSLVLKQNEQISFP